MRRISGLLILLCALFVCPSLADASWRCVRGSVYSYAYPNGTVDPYYYIRYWSNGGWYYRRLGTISTTNASAYSSYGTTGTENWRSRLLDIVANRDRYESASKASALEHNEFLESVKALGLEGNFRWMGYGYAPTYATGAGGYGGSVLGYGAAAPYGNAYGTGYQTLTGNTAWGVGQTPFATASLSTANLDSALNQAGRLVTQAQQLAGQGFNGYSTLVTNVGSAQLDALKTIAQGYAAASALQASRPAENSAPQTSTFSFGAQATGTPTATTAVVSQGAVATNPAAAVTATASAAAPATASNAVETVLLASCINCHGPTRLESSLDARDYQNWSAETWGKVVERITTTDPKRRMPSGGQPLSVEATQTLINTAAAAAATAPAAEAAQ